MMMSVVVTIVDGGSVLEETLDVLGTQQGGHALEILVPYDHLSGEAAALKDSYPDIQLIDLGRVNGGATPRNDLETHALLDIRRAEGLKRATGDLVALVEDRGVPAPDWADAFIRLHARHKEGVLGGPVENGTDRLRNWAVFVCDYGRYQSPLDNPDPEYISDVNICFKRDAILSVRHLWEDGYQEAQVNWALKRQGAGLRLCDDPRVHQKRSLRGIGALLLERFHWARLYGQIRQRETSAAKGVVLALASPLLPFVLMSRHLKNQFAKRRNIGRVLLASPLIFLLLVFWSVGEATGTIEGLMGRTGKPEQKATT